MILLKKFIDLILYSNAWIALAAVAMALQTELLVFGSISHDPLWGFVFFGTLFLYALHRLMGIDKVKGYKDKGRLDIIKDHKRDITIYASLAALASAWFLWRSGPELWIWVGIPVALSLAYVIPVLPGGRRIRDISYIKIFMVAGAWSFITVAMPAIRHHWLLTAPVLVMMVERACFIFAITLPFDIRDVEYDSKNAVKTIPQKLGKSNTRMLGAVLLILMLVAVWLNYRLGTYNTGTALAITSTALIAFGLLWFAKKDLHDYYYTGLVDGLMILQFGVVFFSV